VNAHAMARGSVSHHKPSPHVCMSTHPENMS
jgi:hypothetical protein